MASCDVAAHERPDQSSMWGAVSRCRVVLNGIGLPAVPVLIGFREEQGCSVHPYPSGDRTDGVGCDADPWCLGDLDVSVDRGCGDRVGLGARDVDVAVDGDQVGAFGDHPNVDVACGGVGVDLADGTSGDGAARRGHGRGDGGVDVDERGRRQDLLADAAHTRRWLRTAGLPDASGEEELGCLRTARGAIRTAVANLSDPGAFAAADEILARGRLRLSISEGKVREELEVTDRHWAAAWLAVRNLAEIVGTHPDRIRACAHPGCILYFLDTTRQGTRKWCSMRTCGNRAKSKRNYRKTSRVVRLP